VVETLSKEIGSDLRSASGYGAAAPSGYVRGGLWLRARIMRVSRPAALAGQLLPFLGIDHYVQSSVRYKDVAASRFFLAQEPSRPGRTFGKPGPRVASCRQPGGAC